MSLTNIILLTDSYKATHWRQYPPGTEKVYSYFESRGGQWSDIVFFGLQYYLKKYLAGWTVDAPGIAYARDIFLEHFGTNKLFNKEGWEYIAEEHKGRLPVVIKAVPEGTVVPSHNVLMTIENTDPKCYWLPNYLETLLVQTWYGTTVATQSREMKKIILKYLEKTGDPSLVHFKLHDFGFRGVSSVETAGIGGAAHLVNFKGTDTLAGVMFAKWYYSAGHNGCPMAGFSIPAAEHSTITSWGKDHECDAFDNMLQQYPEGLVAVVSDSYDIMRACHEYWGEELKDKVLGRNGTVVIRPDSGDPPFTVTRVLNALGMHYGFEKNAKGYNVLNPHIRVIQGDGIDYAMLDKILEAMEEQEWSADNIAFGSGGGLLQKLNRDTLKFAFKCSSVTVNGEERDVYKAPATDLGKASKKGRLKLVSQPMANLTHDFRTVSAQEAGEDALVEVFRNGEVKKEWTFEEVRERAKIG